MTSRSIAAALHLHVGDVIEAIRRGYVEPPAPIVNPFLAAPRQRRRPKLSPLDVAHIRMAERMAGLRFESVSLREMPLRDWAPQPEWAREIAR